MRALVLLATLSVTLAVGLAGQEAASAAQAGPTFRINGVGLGMSPDSVGQLLGAPRKIEGPRSSEVTDQPVLTWTYPALEVIFFGQEATYVTCYNGPCSTPERVHLGTLRAEVVRRYGPGTPADGDRLWHYLIAGSDCGLSVEFVADKVSGLVLWCDYS